MNTEPGIHKSNNPCVLIMAGGTGGHVFPGLAVAAALVAQGYRVEWLGSVTGIEQRLVPEAGIRLNSITVQGVRGSGVKRKLLAPFMLIKATWQALRCVRQCRPVLALGFGGFASGPGGLAATLAGVPLVLHEQNTAPGLTNRILSVLATRVTEAFSGAFAKKAVTHVGNPVRENIVALPTPEQRYANRSGDINVLVLGGSQGALALNRNLPALLASVDVPMNIRHQAGKGKQQEADQAYRHSGAQAEVIEFIDDMAACYAWADLVICRAGALTVSEVACAGVAAVFIPLPTAVDNHQVLNARYLSDKDAAFLLEQKDMNETEMKKIFSRVSGRQDLMEMASRARQLAIADSTERLVKVCKEVARG